MKKLFLLLLVSLSVLACDDDNDLSNPIEDVSGTWTEIPSYVNTESTIYNCDLKKEYTINIDQTVTFKNVYLSTSNTTPGAPEKVTCSDADPMSGTFSVTNNTIIFTYSEEIVTTYNYKFEGENLVLYSGQYSETYTKSL